MNRRRFIELIGAASAGIVGWKFWRHEKRAMSALIQKAHGVGSATFANPTQAGSSILVMMAIDDGASGHLAPTDNQGNFYDQVSSAGNNHGGTQVDAWYAPTLGNATTGGVTTVTVPIDAGGSWYVWIYEVTTNQFFKAAPDHLPPIDVHGANWDTSASPVGLPILPIGTGDNPGPDGDFCLAVVSGATITSVDSPWVLDTIQGGNAVAYLEFSANGTQPFPQFHASGSSSWTLDQAYYPVATPTPPTSADEPMIFVTT